MCAEFFIPFQCFSVILYICPVHMSLFHGPQLRNKVLLSYLIISGFIIDTIIVNTSRKQLIVPYTLPDTHTVVS